MRGTRNNYYCDSSYGDCGSEMSTMAGPEMLFGWHWTFDSGLNTSFAFGLAKRLDGNNGSDDPEVNGYFRVGNAV